jgi:hypothetical protein
MKNTSKRSPWVPPTKLNPLVQNLNLIADKQTYFNSVEHRPEKEFDFSVVDARERKRVFGSEFYCPSELTWKVYEAISDMLEFGYRYKNITYPSYYAKMNAAALSDDEKFGGRISATERLEMGGAIIAPAGIGKTEAIEKALSMIPSRIIHPSEHSAFQKPFLQVPYLIADVNGRSSLGLLEELLMSIDELAGTTLYADLPSRNTEDGLLKKLRNACWQHGVGLVILDEAQMFITESGKQQGSDTKNAKFLQRLFSFLRLPILLIGTPELETFLSCNPHTFRRYKKDADVMWNNYALESEYWQTTVESILQEYVFCRNVKVSEAYQRQIYSYTAGNYSALQIYCKELITYVEKTSNKFLSEQVLKEVYQVKQRVLNKLTELHGKPAENLTDAATTSKSAPNGKPNKRNGSSKSDSSVAVETTKELGRAAHDIFRVRN